MIDIKAIRKEREYFGHIHQCKGKTYMALEEYQSKGYIGKRTQLLPGGIAKLERKTFKLDSNGNKIVMGHTWSKTKHGKWKNWSTFDKALFSMKSKVYWKYDEKTGQLIPLI